MSGHLCHISQLNIRNVSSVAFDQTAMRVVCASVNEFSFTWTTLPSVETVLNLWFNSEKSDMACQSLTVELLAKYPWLANLTVRCADCDPYIYQANHMTLV
jgi:hypothetical protein